MAYEAKEGDFSLFKNTKKTEENHPDYTGKCRINGKDMRVAAWIKKGESGLAFFTGKISEFQQKSDNVEDPLNPSSSKADDLHFQPVNEKDIQVAEPQDDLPF